MLQMKNIIIIPKHNLTDTNDGLILDACPPNARSIVPSPRGTFPNPRSTVPNPRGSVFNPRSVVPNFITVFLN